MLSTLRHHSVVKNACKMAKLHYQSKATFAKFDVLNPYTGEVYSQVDYKTKAQAVEILTNSYKLYRDWRFTPLEKRIEAVQKAGEYFKQNEDQIAKDITCQMGKPLKQAKEEVKYFHVLVKKMCEIAPEALAEKVIRSSEGGISKYTREPVGCVLSIAPWNYPVSTTGNIVIPSILSGNTVLLKPSPYTPLIAQHFENAFNASGVPGLVRALNIPAQEVKELYAYPEIGYVSFTGSIQTGKCVQEDVDDHRFINVNLELGGNDACYVAEDADVDFAVRELMNGAFYNAGQSCNAVERIYVHKNVYEDFLEKAAREAEEWTIGDPLRDTTKLGPLCLPEKPEQLSKMIEDAANQQGRILCGGLPTLDSAGKGRFFLPTVIADAQNDMEAMINETFGPVTCVAPTDGDDEVIKLINDSQFGLTSSIFTKDRERLFNMAPRLKVGTVYGNRCLKLDPLLPWSSRKRSGRGVSLSHLGFHAVTNPKSYNFLFHNT